MAGTQRAVFLSDLHLCSNPRIDDFVWDGALRALTQAPELIPGGEERLDLVLLGDTFDLWQSVSETECKAKDASAIDLAFTAASEVERIGEVLERHGDCVEALGEFARRPGCRLVVVPGNHDHVLVDAAVQQAVAARLGLAPGASALTFAPCYESAELMLYADHGCQYDCNNSYGDFGSLKLADEAAGYFFVKLFFNRVEYRDPRLENSPGGWGAVWHWLRRVLDFGLLATAIRWFWQYWSDGRVARRLAIPGTRRGGPAVDAAALAMPMAPALLLGSARGRSAERFFALDPEMEEFFRAAYQESAEVRKAVNEILEAQEAVAPRRGAPRRGAAARKPARRSGASASPRPEVPMPRGHSRAASVRRGDVSADHPQAPALAEDVGWAQRLYTDKPWFRARLSRAETQYVVFGHTHGELAQPLSNGATYLNTGTWTGADSRLPLVLAECEPGGAPSVRLLHYRGGRIG